MSIPEIPENRIGQLVLKDELAWLAAEVSSPCCGGRLPRTRLLDGEAPVPPADFTADRLAAADELGLDRVEDLVNALRADRDRS
ncbi:hypothetical protein PA7_37160 [Pseudonocardia asaccharolytica DSM 44247 = NBRC 16224]|uniref:Uncharacterized protein n=1 Tax=Pseudonocardia asaccharolytica DSM 44247 = NBRC 16224 TaxID=1123024 RepID=A0A511D504_9PSEU|nr:hypothetical protein PA7_37160 [Pseudonocardia asaccharolytica DSM 44247 = NBRC 16224]